ncbi:hypothetical protein [Bdellovibrio reynosensis]|uniref:Uncharacterized protein n=1 Tax=Bdellovibrio reynosensis TaxID=2835041 RepID=A0ABY4C7Q8_9BACT|nr:hypothetical protein [Bdellovibrio reynosensis]UOE99941.1 hypothetical protein MNR06_09545 [Bdellovibrio reynosensis]
MIFRGPFFILILLLTFQVSAAPALEWWAASATDVMQAPCKTQRPPSPDSILTALQGSGLLVTKKVNGITFKNEKADLVQFFTDLHKLDLSLRDKPELNFSSNCDKVLCAVKEIYGNTEGPQLLYLLKTFGFNGSHLRSKYASAWHSDELNEILQALFDYPLSLYPVSYNKRLVHFTRGMGFGPMVIANASIEIFDPWNDLSFPERQQTFLHELGHTLSYKSKLDVSEEWLKVAGWKAYKAQKNKISYTQYQLIDPSKAVSEYGMENPSEDFAETVVAYRFTGAKLKTHQPHKYSFMKNKVFYGQEYLPETQCSLSFR